MAAIRGLIDMMINSWNTLSLLKIDGVSWTSIVLAFIVFFAILGGFFRIKR